LLVPPGAYEVEVSGPHVLQSRRVDVGAGENETVTVGTPETTAPPSPAPSPPPAPPPTPIPAPTPVPETPPGDPPPPPSPGSEPVPDLLTRGHALLEEGAYDEARAVYLQAQQREPGNLDVARAIAEVDRVLSTIAALPLRERENLEILREEVRRTSVVGDYAGLRRAAARLFALVPRDPATLAALRRGFVRS